MTDERERKDGAEGPQRPESMRRQLLRTDHPGAGGNVGHDQVRTAAGQRADARHAAALDPRFAQAPMSAEEMKALHLAPDLEAACGLLGQMQEERHKDGRLPSPVLQAGKPAPLLVAYLSLDEQIARGAKPTASELAYLQSARTPEEEKTRTEGYLEERNARNKALFERSRNWGAELDRAARDERPPNERLNRGGIEGWQSDLAEEQKEAYRAPVREIGGALAADPRFATASLTREEMQVLGNAENDKAAARLLGQFHEARLKDGRLVELRDPRAQKAQINQALSPKQQIELGLRPTAEQVAFMVAGAMHGQEHVRTMDFIAGRKAQNAHWFAVARQRVQASHEASQTIERQLAAAKQERASSYWFQRELNARPAAGRDARSKKGERRTDLQQQKAERALGRESASEKATGQDRDPGSDGGRGR